jgi:predicted GIY-YIG superfamily endonuclease
MESKVYLLECEKGKYYVGKTKAIRKRVIDHFIGKGSEWTKLYKPIKILSIFDGDSIFSEENNTILFIFYFFLLTQK